MNKNLSILQDFCFPCGAIPKKTLEELYHFFFSKFPLTYFSLYMSLNKKQMNTLLKVR